jgi:hypothetical protein
MLNRAKKQVMWLLKLLTENNFINKASEKKWRNTNGCNKDFWKDGEDKIVFWKIYNESKNTSSKIK